MLISCPSCKASFAVPAKAIGETGKKVKCTKCAHVWFQEPVRVDKSKLDNIPANIEAKPEDNKKLPVKIPAKVSIAAVIALVFMVAISAGLFALKNANNYPAVAKILKLEDYNNIKFVNFASSNVINDNKLDFKISGKIVNTSNAQAKIPPVEVAILSKGGMVITSSELKIEKETLEPYEIYDFNQELTKITGNADKVVLSYGNWLEKKFMQ